jgi:hypothetical protein
MVDTIGVYWDDLNIEKIDSGSDLIKRISFNIQSGSVEYPVVIFKEYPNKILYELRNE